MSRSLRVFQQTWSWAMHPILPAARLLPQFPGLPLPQRRRGCSSVPISSHMGMWDAGPSRQQNLILRLIL